jgi:hypothetical protein
VSPGIEEEGRMLSGGVDVVVVRKLRQREERVPVVLSLADEQPEELL